MSHLPRHLDLPCTHLTCGCMDAYHLLQAVHSAAIPAPVPVWAVADLQRAILMLPGPFTTCRLVQRNIPRCHLRFALQNSEVAMRQLQSSGLGVTVQTRKNQVTFHKPLPTPENKPAVEKALAGTYSWDKYVSCFSQIATLSIHAAHAVQFSSSIISLCCLAEGHIQYRPCAA